MHARCNKVHPVVVVVIVVVVFFVFVFFFVGGGNCASGVLQHAALTRQFFCGGFEWVEIAAFSLRPTWLVTSLSFSFPFSFPFLNQSLISAVRHPYAINGVPLETSPAKPADLFAVVVFSGTQFKVAVDDVIVADRIEGVDIGQMIDLSNVLLVGSRRATVIGRPAIAGAKVVAAVEEITKDKKVIAFKTRRRKHSRRLKGFRREVTVLRVADIVLGDQISKDELATLL